MITRNACLSLSLCFVAVTERWHFIQVNGQGANTWKTPKGWKEWLWSNVLSSHVITPDSWSGRGENVGRCYGYWRKRGGWKEISDTVPRLDERRHFKERKKGKRKKSDRCSRESSCVGLSRHTLIDQVSHSLILGSKKRIHPHWSLSLPFPFDKPSPIPLSHARSRKSRNRGLRPPTSPWFDRNLSWKEALTDS